MDAELKSAKSAYRNAKAEENHQEQARWANVIGDIHKNRGEYKEALEWLNIDYHISRKHLKEKHLLPTCQSLGEIYLRLEKFPQALTYQKNHLELAREANDLVEQQRASTQLGRTYLELFTKSEYDHRSIRKAKKYFKSAMDLAMNLKEKRPNNKSYLKEYIDAHNNMGTLEVELENWHEAMAILIKGLMICDEEEISHNDDGRSRLHHNLGRVYMELRSWDDAKKHMEKDIHICNRIGHRQGEAKGYINLGEVHHRIQMYEEANSYYEKALTLVKMLDDEHALMEQIKSNIKIVKKAASELQDITRLEQNLKKLKRDKASAKEEADAKKILVLQNKTLDILIDKAGTIFAWEKHCEFAKEKKKIAKELYDQERLGDSYLNIGESYQKLRKFNKAIKWYKKSWETFKKYANLEGQALVKINIGNILDSTQDWRGALGAYQDSYRIAVEAKLPDVQLNALENMHYSNMIRFDDENETRRLKLLIDKLKKSEEEPEAKTMPEICCSETDTKADHLSDGGSDDFCFPKTVSWSKSLTDEEEFTDDMPLMSLYQSIKGSSKKNTGHMDTLTNSSEQAQMSPKDLTKLTSNHQTAKNRKRTLVISSDEDDDDDEKECSSRRDHNCAIDDFPTSDAIINKASPRKVQVVSEYRSECPINVEESSSSSFKCSGPIRAAKTSRHSGSWSNDIIAEADFPSGSKCDIDSSEKQKGVAHPLVHYPQNELQQYITCQVGNDRICVKAALCTADDQLNTDLLKAIVPCLYYLQFPAEKKSEGLLPIIKHIKCAGRDLESLEPIEKLKENLGSYTVEAFFEGWIHKHLIKMYVDCCNELSEVPNIKVLKNLYNLEVSDDEIVVSDCDLQDLSITPLINALQSQKAFAMLDISHNLLGNGAMEKLQKVFSALDQSYGGLTLDLHCNRFGPTALFQICECSELFTRLEVLNISGNRLTDACGSYLSTILKRCTALYSLNVENCCITSRTIQKIADALDSKSVLAHLCIGYNSPVSGNVIVNLLSKLSTLKRFSELNMRGLKLGKPVIHSLCQLAGSLTLSGLILGGTGIGTEGAIELAESLVKGTEELVKLDLSYCGLTSKYILNTNVNFLCSIVELNLEGNPIMREGSNTLFSLLTNAQCCLKVLVLRKCQLGRDGVLHIIEALADNSCLEELDLADNSVPNELSPLQNDLSVKRCSQNQDRKLDNMNVDDNQEVLCSLNTVYDQLEVADSEDEETPFRVEGTASGIDDSCANSYQRDSSSLECHFTKQLSSAIGLASSLELLDLSNNGFPAQAAEAFYGSWKTLRPLSSQKHITEKIIHFSTKEKRCCGVKPCCRKV